ncbi:MAG: chromosomal replication initiator protein DnaA [Anaerolineales bacterium]|nr:chromosomal replication initiator protein DnaA [Anaerolineales bacterium]MCB0016247.1 chromosomal replication initiator protein DnaA [Anaerolineales bacterium]
MLPEAAWKATLGQLEMQMTRATFDTWLKGSSVAKHSGTAYVIRVRNDYARDWLTHRLHDTIVRTLSAVLEAPATVSFTVKEEVVAPAGAPATVSAISHEGQTEALPLKAHYTFANFVVGPSNQLAHAAAQAVAEKPGSSYNPLFIYGGVGLGKTHLLQAIGHRCLEQGFSVCYVTSETFTNDLIAAIRQRRTEQFRSKYRTTDVLLIDDVQFVAGKESTQEELFHTFNDLHREGRQVILSSDRPPKAMVTLEERLRSRFAWGLMADIQMPAVETRAAILRIKAESNGLHLSDDVIELMASAVRNNIRELEGALTKVIAYAQLTGVEIDRSLVERVLADLIKRPRKVTVDRVLETVAQHYGVSEAALLGASRSRTVAFPRQIVMYLARTETDASLPQIGRRLGGRDHSTVLYGYEKINGLLETNADIRREAMAIRSALYETQLSA